MITLWMGIILFVMNAIAFERLLWLHKMTWYRHSTPALLFYLALLILTEIFVLFAPSAVVALGIKEVEKKRESK